MFTHNFSSVLFLALIVNEWVLEDSSCSGKFLYDLVRSGEEGFPTLECLKRPLD